MNSLEEDPFGELVFDPPDGLELVGFWCFRAGGHICDEPCKSDSVPLFATAGQWAHEVRQSIAEHGGSL